MQHFYTPRERFFLDQNFVQKRILDIMNGFIDTDFFL